MDTTTKAYIEKDISALHPILNDLGFVVQDVCANGNIIETWTHEPTGLIIYASYKYHKKNRKRFRWFGDWDNFHVYVKNHHPTRSVHQLNKELKRELVGFLSGRFETKEKTDTSLRLTRKHIPLHDTVDENHIRGVLQHVIDLFTFERSESNE